jgi:adenine-specific DNA-methyltransferase
MATSQAPTAQDRFLSLLKRDILKLDAAELDFGIYRILNYRRNQILAYLDTTLPARIAEWTRALLQSGDPELAESEAANCYYHLHTFFSRYWDEGDFIPRARRGGTAAYAVPYNGQDTHFHWATKGSHYVKSGELFSRFAYRDGTHEVRFVIQRADTEKDNAKGAAKYFFPVSTRSDDGAFEVAWAWRAATDAENARYKAKGAARATDADDAAGLGDAGSGQSAGATMQDRVLDAWLSGSDFKSAKRPKAMDAGLLAKNARRFVRKNTSDFFVHPHLGEFLGAELDVYLKHEFVQVWNAPDSELPRIRAKFNLVRSIALDLITFLDQIERFQATLFEKRKFVLQADYLVQCSWLVREAGAVGQALVNEAAANPQQAVEWAGWVGSSAKKPNGKKLLADYPHLPLHTRHFNSDFKARVLACFDDIEAALAGELVHADNYAALRTLEPAYRERVKCIYIDPPYNTGNDGFLYKDTFAHGSWLSLLDARIRTAIRFLTARGSLYVSIADHEQARLRLLLDDILGHENFLAQVIWQKVFSPKNTAQFFSEDHDYILAFAKSIAFCRLGVLPRTEEMDARFSNPDGDSRGDWSSSDLSARNFYSEGVYPVTSPTGRVIDGPPPGTYWRVSSARFAELDQDGRIWWGPSRDGVPRLKRFLTEVKDGRTPQTLWQFKDVGHTQEAKQSVLELMPGERDGEFFNTIKPIRLMQQVQRIAGVATDEYVLDFFAGTASTGHGTLSLNREDGGKRKFLLVEQGGYFDTVTLPRVAKVMLAPEWKDGKPKDTVQHDAAGDPDHWSRRTLPLVRVLRLERYEDSLNALEFQSANKKGASQISMDLVATDAQEHLLRYWLSDALAEQSGQAVRLSTDKLNDPFAYQLTLHESTGPRPVQVDLLETARLLLGLVPRRQRELRDADGQRHQLMEAVMAADLARGVAQPRPVLVWLRAVSDERPAEVAKAEHAWLGAQVQSVFGRALAEYGTVYHNRAAYWPAGQRGDCIDGLMAASMMERAH